MKISRYILPLVMTLAMTSCDTDIVPRGQSVLGTAPELEYLLNGIYVLVKPSTDLGIVVNETYGEVRSTVKNQISNSNTLAAAYLAYDESVDRNGLSTADNRYTSIYKNINNLNIILNKIGEASGSADDKARISAEAHLLRGYMYYLAAGIYAAQYDAATCDNTNGIVYTDNYAVEAKPQLTVGEIWKKILEDCDDEYIALLPETASYLRCSRATGNAIKAKVLFQMKRYSEALTYAQAALKINSSIEDRRTIESAGTWTASGADANNLIYIPALSFAQRSSCPTYEQLSVETVDLFEPGDMVKEYAYMHAAYKGYASYLAWNKTYGKRDSGVDGCVEYSYGGTYLNPWGITVERIMYLAAECLIRGGKISDGMGLVNDIREKRIHPNVYQPFEASTEAAAMQLLQRAKFIENIASYENFFDRKRWNSEANYKVAITRTLPDIGTYTVSPESPLWIMPMPIQVFQNNPYVTPNI